MPHLGGRREWGKVGEIGVGKGRGTEIVYKIKKTVFKLKSNLKINNKINNKNKNSFVSKIHYVGL